MEERKSPNIIVDEFSALEESHEGTPYYKGFDAYFRNARAKKMREKRQEIAKKNSIMKTFGFILTGSEKEIKKGRGIWKNYEVSTKVIPNEVYQKLTYNKLVEKLALLNFRLGELLNAE